MLQIALPVLVYRATDSIASSALMMTVGLLPAVLLSPATGVLADRWDRRRLLCAVCAGQVLVAAPLLVADGAAVAVSIGYLVMAGQAAVASLFEPARNALVPTLVGASGTSRTTAANGLLGSGTTIARLVGASLGGTVFAYGGLSGLYLAYTVALGLALCALLAPFAPFASRSEAPRERETARCSMSREWLDGLAVIRAHRPLRRVLLVLAVMSVSQGLFLALFVPFVLDVLDAGAQAVGLLRGVQAIGGLAAGLALATVASRVRPSLLLGWGSTAFGLLSATVWNTPYLTTGQWAYVVLFALIGAPGVIAMGGLLSIFQTVVGQESAGRVLSTAFGTVALCTAAGMLIAGSGVEVVGLRPLLNIQAGLYSVAGVLAFALLGTRR